MIFHRPWLGRAMCVLSLLAAGVLVADGGPGDVPRDAGWLRPGTLLTDGGATPVPGMLSNSVTQLRLMATPDGDSLLWGANSFGLLRSDDFGAHVATYTDSLGLGRGGVSGLAANPWLVAAATVTDTSIADVQGAGTGIAFSLDRGASWTWLPQPIDSVEDESINPRDWVAIDCETGERLDWLMETPVRTPVENITWGLALEGDTAIWAASFAGGFRRYSLATGCWRVEVPDRNRFQPVSHLNHRAFSVLASDGGIWAGSAGGLNFLPWDSLHAPERSRLGGGWRLFRYQEPQLSGVPTVTGNWVVTMARQALADGDAIWVAGWATFASIGDYYGLTWTRDDGATWTEVEDLRGLKIWDLAFDDDDVWVASDEGLWKSNAGGAAGSWNRYPLIRDSTTGRGQYGPAVYAVTVAGGRLLVGTPRGFFASEDRGLNWTSTHHEPRPLLVFPSPFSPAAHGFATVAVELERAGGVSVRVYDFAMALVREVAVNRQLPAGESREITWDGTNRAGERVANGVYFVHIEGPGVSSWSKLMVIR
jgi:hypothetical protein